MNKYEKALERIKKKVVPQDSWTEEDYEHFQTITEALERQVPKICKLFKDVCDCGHTVYPHMDNCDKCGKALVWGKGKDEGK